MFGRRKKRNHMKIEKVYMNLLNRDRSCWWKIL